MVENLVTKLSAAMKDIKAVEKDGNNDFQNYTFQSESAIKNAVKQALQNHDLMIIPSYKVTEQYDRKSSKGSLNHFVDVLGTFEITDGSQSMKGEMPGSGQDTGEKATAKACTSAQKYFYKQLFNISDKDEDPDKYSAPVPWDASYRRNEDAQKMFDQTDSPLAFYRMLDHEQEVLADRCDQLAKIKTINHLESVKFRVRLRSSDSGSYAAQMFGGVVMVDKGIFPIKTIFTFARYQKLAKDYPELPKFDENDPRFEFLDAEGE